MQLGRLIHQSADFPPSFQEENPQLPEQNGSELFSFNAVFYDLT